VTGAGPMVEIFTDRVEFTNPGEPLVDTLRFIDTPPRSRNEGLAALMRRMKICEEGGTGIDKVVEAVEMFQLPAPEFEAILGFTKATLFAHQNLIDMDAKDRIRACYQHACLCLVTNRRMTNTTLRDRLGIEVANAAQASRIIKDAIAKGLIKLFAGHSLSSRPSPGRKIIRSNYCRPSWRNNLSRGERPRLAASFCWISMGTELDELVDWIKAGVPDRRRWKQLRGDTPMSDFLDRDDLLALDIDRADVSSAQGSKTARRKERARPPGPKTRMGTSGRQRTVAPGGSEGGGSPTSGSL